MKLKVAVAFPRVPFIRGGAELLVESLTENLKKRGYNAEIVEIPFKWYPGSQLWEQMLMWKTVDLTESNGQKIDVLIGTKFPSYFAKHPNKIVWLMHQHREAYDLADSEWSPFSVDPDMGAMLQAFRDADGRALLESKKIFSISKNITGRLKRYNDIDSEPLYHPPKHAGRYYSENYGDYILSVGRLDPMKRLDLLIDAMRFTNKKVKCVIAGTGNIRDDLQKRIDLNGLSDRVKLIGFVSDEELLRLYADCFAVYFAPLDEDYGYITLEAFLSFKPVVTCTDSGGVLEFASDKESGFISNPVPEEIGKNINRLYNDRGLAKRMGQAGFETVKDISWENTIDRIMHEAEKNL